MGSVSRAIREYLAQFILIVFSVVFGLYLSERIEDRKERQAAEDLLVTIESEVKDNTQLLEHWYPYHHEIYKNLDSLSKDAEFVEQFINDKYFLFERLFHRGTFMSRSPASDAWEIAKAHPLIVKIDYDKYLILSRIYNQQEVTFANMQEEIFALFNTNGVNARKDAKSNLELIANHIRELVAREKQLMYYYRKGEKMLHPEADGEAAPVSK